MNREVHVRFCERRGVRFPSATHPMFAAYERGDPLTPLAWADPEMEYVVVGGTEPGNVQGLAQIEAGWREYMSAWEEFSIEAEEYRELDDERVLVPARFHGRGKASGTEVTRARGCHLFHLRSGKVARQVFYWDRKRSPTSASLLRAARRSQNGRCERACLRATS